MSAKKHCDQCDWDIVNGIFVHEHGCLNFHKTWEPEEGRWIKYVRCILCDCEVAEGEEHDCYEDAQ